MIGGTPPPLKSPPPIACDGLPLGGGGGGGSPSDNEMRRNGLEGPTGGNGHQTAKRDQTHSTRGLSAPDPCSRGLHLPGQPTQGSGPSLGLNYCLLLNFSHAAKEPVLEKVH